MTTSEDGLKLIEHFECAGDVTKFLKAYRCQAGVLTIGIGTTVYPDGTKVKEDDEITKEFAYECLAWDLKNTEKAVMNAVTTTILQHQFDALVSLTYNIGIAGFKGSTVLKRVNKNPFDPMIELAFLMWNKVKGQISYGLQRRRMSESYLYFNNELKFEF